jgi:outer membrane protein OmpA-like peptidoglycan-associated protein
MRGILVYILLISIFNSGLSAQDKKAFKSQFLEAEYFFLIGEFNEARFIYSELLKQDPTNANLQFLIGACFLSLDEEKSKAIPYLEKAVESISPGYREGSYKERNAPKESLFALARAYHITNQLEKASECYGRYYNIMKLQNPEEIDFVLKQIESCKLAGIMLKTSLPYTRTPFSSDFNAYASNFNAILSQKDSMMIYMRKKTFYTAIMMTRLVNGRWTNPIAINDQLGIDDHSYVCSLSADGTELYLSLEEDQIYDIYVSRFKKGKWTKAEKLNNNINTYYSETHASVSSDGKRLYFTSDRPDGIGAMDIWVSDWINEKEGWGPAKNLGEPVNSVYSEETPFITQNGQILFFSSMGHATMGGFDIFYSSLLPTGKWSYPANLGYPISTCDDDLFYFPLGSGKQGLFSGFMDEQQGKQKIYLVNLDTSLHFENIALRGTIKLEDKIQELDESFTVQIINSKNSDTLLTIKPNKETGEFTADLEPGNYELSMQGKGYTETKENITVVEGISKNEIRMETAMTPVNVSSGEFLIIRNVLFAFNDFSLNDEAKADLEMLYRAMQLHPQILVQVTGHADAKGSEEYNLKLSNKRARAIVDFLVDKGIEKERFVSLGIGEQQSIALNQNPDGSDNPEGRRLNRYAEIKLINNSDEKIVIAQTEVPQHLRPKKDELYSVLLIQSNDPKYIPHNLPGIKVLLTETDHARLFLTEEFRDKSKSVEILNTAIDNGFPDARILDQVEREKLILSLSDRKEESLPPYAIQIMALKKPVDLRSMDKKVEISQLIGKDGLYRYVIGLYPSKDAAIRELQEVYIHKFPDAFIIPLSKYSNQTGINTPKSESVALYYTIQFSATRKPADKSKYKDLGDVRVSFGQDGYYRYSAGLYSDRSQAESELKRIKALGFSDAFLRKMGKPSIETP